MRVRLGFIGILVMLCLGIMFSGTQKPNQQIVVHVESSTLSVDQQLHHLSQHLSNLGSNTIEISHLEDGTYVITYASDRSLLDVRSQLEDYKNGLLIDQHDMVDLISFEVQEIHTPTGDWNLTDVPTIETRREFLRAQYQPVLAGYLHDKYETTAIEQTEFVRASARLTYFTKVLNNGLPETRAGPNRS